MIQAQRPHLGAVALLGFVLLAWGGAAGPHPWDVGELVAAAARLGGSHAPGQPLHALLGYAIARIPLGSMVARISWLSSLGAAIAAYALGRIVHALADRDDGRTRVAAALASISLLLTPAVLRSAMRPEVYTLALACVMLGAWALAERARGYRHGLRVAALCAGLAFALHPPHALALAAMALVGVIAKRPGRVELASSFGLGLVVTIALIAYLPVRGAAGAPMWGDPTTASGLWTYVSGAPYRDNLGSAQSDALAVATYLLIAAPASIAVLLAPRQLGWALALVAVVAALVQPFEERNPDNVAYDAPAIAMLLAAAAATLARAERRLHFGLVLLPLSPLWLSIDGGHLAPVDLPALETLAFETLSAPGPRALLVTRTDFIAASVMLGQEVDRLRPDVAHFVEGLATSSWHWRSLQTHPAFDGRPHRTEGGELRRAYVLGAVAHAHGQVEVDVENPATIGERGALRGAWLVLGQGGVDTRTTAERTMGAIASSLAWPRQGDHEIGAQIVRDVISRRAPLLVARGHAAEARAELVAAAPIARDAIAGIVDRPLAPASAIVIRDPAYALSSREDVTRGAAVLLDRDGSTAAAIDMLEAQQARGDDLAIAQLAAIHLAHGLVTPARDAWAAYRSRQPDVRSPDLDALAASLR